MDIGSSNVCIRFVGIAGQSCYSAAAPASSNELLLPSKSVLNAEGAVRRCAQALNIDPIRRHLFGLFDCNGQFWLAPNQSLTQYAASGHYLEFRLRLFPYQLQSLKINVSSPKYNVNKLHTIKCVNSYIFRLTAEYERRARNRIQLPFQSGAQRFSEKQTQKVS